MVLMQVALKGWHLIKPEHVISWSTKENMNYFECKKKKKKKFELIILVYVLIIYEQVNN